MTHLQFPMISSRFGISCGFSAPQYEYPREWVTWSCNAQGMSAIENSRHRLGYTVPLWEILGGLLERWSEPHRAYHALSHLDAALVNLDEFELASTELDIIEWALWFHDAIYDPTAADNEERSAVLAHEQIDHHLPVSTVDEVARLVRLTAGHVVDPGDRIGGIMIDIDLSILGAPSDVYAAYAIGVRHEYSHRNDDDFREGRGTFLEAMLARDQIFNTPRGIELWEIRTRTNLVTELAALSDR